MSSRPSSLLHHLPYKCGACPKKYSERADLERHMFETHERETIPPLLCPLPNNLTERPLTPVNSTVQMKEKTVLYPETSSSSAATRTSSSGNEKRFLCYCGKSFSEESFWETHNECAHRAKKVMFQCSACLKKFIVAKTLSEHHEVAHEANKKCNLCDKSFTRADTLKMHNEAVHQEKKNFKCEKCGKVFSKSESLKLHNDAVHQEMAKISKTTETKVELQKVNQNLPVIEENAQVNAAFDVNNNIEELEEKLKKAKKYKDDITASESYLDENTYESLNNQLDIMKLEKRYEKGMKVKDEVNSLTNQHQDLINHDDYFEMSRIDKMKVTIAKAEDIHHKIKEVLEKRKAAEECEDFLNDDQFEQLAHELKAKKKRLEGPPSPPPVPADKKDGCVMVDTSDMKCVICSKLPKGNVWACPECENIICSSCKSKLAECPSCKRKVDLLFFPLRRNKTVERILHKMRK